MQKTKRRTLYTLKLLMLALITTGLFANSGAITLVPSSYAQSLRPSATPVTDDGFRRAVAEALQELTAARKLIEAQDAEIKVKDEVIALERQLSDGLRRWKTLSETEIAELRKAVAAKDKVIADYEAEIVVLKKQRTSVWKKAEIFIVGAATGVVVGMLARR